MHTMNVGEKTGLRDRKRRETRARLEEAPVTLELGDCSPRNFFNYFDSKDSAIMGLRHLEITDETVADYVAGDDGDDLVRSVVHLLFLVMDAPPSRPNIREDRFEIVRRYPQILGGQLAQMTLMSGRLSQAVQIG